MYQEQIEGITSTENIKTKAWKGEAMGPAGNLDKYNLATVQGTGKQLLKERDEAGRLGRGI